MKENAFYTTSRRDRSNEFYDAVRKEYSRLRGIKKGGVRLYSDEYVLAAVAKKFFRASKTIENIVFHRVK